MRGELGIEADPASSGAASRASGPEANLGAEAQVGLEARPAVPHADSKDLADQASLTTEGLERIIALLNLERAPSLLLEAWTWARDHARDNARPALERAFERVEAKLVELLPHVEAGAASVFSAAYPGSVLVILWLSIVSTICLWRLRALVVRVVRMAWCCICCLLCTRCCCRRRHRQAVSRSPAENLFLPAAEGRGAAATPALDDAGRLRHWAPTCCAQSRLSASGARTDGGASAGAGSLPHAAPADGGDWLPVRRGHRPGARPRGGRGSRCRGGAATARRWQPRRSAVAFRKRLGQAREPYPGGGGQALRPLGENRPHCCQPGLWCGRGLAAVVR